MKTIVASSLALAAMTSVALADGPTPSSQSTGLLRLTDGQMDLVTAGQTQTNNNDCLAVCNNNNQQARSGSNTAGDFSFGNVQISISLPVL